MPRADGEEGLSHITEVVDQWKGHDMKKITVTVDLWKAHAQQK